MIAQLTGTLIESSFTEAILENTGAASHRRHLVFVALRVIGTP